MPRGGYFVSMFLRARFARSAVRSFTTRRPPGGAPLSAAFQTGDDEVRYRTEKNPVVPPLANLQKRWHTMDAGAQDDVVAYLEDLMRGDWRALTAEQRRAAMYVWYGPWGPRSPTPEKDPADLLIAYSYAVGTAGAALILYKLAFADPAQPVPGIDYE